MGPEPVAEDGSSLVYTFFLNRVCNKTKSERLLLVFIYNFLAQGYLPGGSPRKYCGPCTVSLSSSRWIGVVPVQQVHQEILGEILVFVKRIL